MSGQHLFLFQIGPVQSFIAAARKTQDLYVGSYILSVLASAGVRAASNLSGFESIFPVEAHFNQGRSPHRFSFLCEEKSEVVARAVRAVVEARWKDDFALPVRRLLESANLGDRWQAVFDRQAYDWLELYWVAVKYDSENHAASYKQASIAMAQRKYARHFPQVNEPGWKCSLTGAQSALDLIPEEWNKLRTYLDDGQAILIRKNEQLGSLALIKRLAPRASEDEGNPIAGLEKFPSTAQIAANDMDAPEDGYPNKDVAGYLAVLHMDGDRMGERLGQLAGLGAHKEFSEDLAAFGSEQAESIVRFDKLTTARLIYAGGDDVLALLPLKHALRCARELRAKFGEATQCTASAGIAITPADLPLDRALDLSRTAEEEAKEQYGRDAIVVVEAHGTGQMRGAGANWSLLPLVEEVQNLFASGMLSGRLGYDLMTIEQYLFGPELSAARAAEVQRLAKRRTSDPALFEEKVKPVIERMINAVEAPETKVSWNDMSNWVILARFLAQGGTERSTEKQS